MATLSDDLRLPTEPGQLTDAWLTHILRASGAVTTARVVGHTWDRVALQGAAGVVGRVTLTPDNADPGAPVGRH